MLYDIVEILFLILSLPFLLICFILGILIIFGLTLIILMMYSIIFLFSLFNPDYHA